MISDNQTAILAAAQAVIRPNYSGDPVDWAEANILEVPDSPVRGRLSLARTPWLAAALRIICDAECKVAVVMAATQSGKSLLQRVYMAWQIVNQPGPMLTCQPNDPEARDWLLRYVRPLFRATPAVQALLSENDNDKSMTADFKNGVTLCCRGIWNENNLQRLSLRTVIVDEAWLAPRGHLAEVAARLQAFSWLGRAIYMSQGGRITDEFSALYEGSDKREWHMSCPACSALQPWRWEFVRFPSEAKVNGVWDLQKVEAGTTYECCACKVRLKDSPGVRAVANDPQRGAGFAATSKAATWGTIGLHWNCLINSSFGKEGVRMLRARQSYDQYGDEDGRRQFKQKRLAQPWAEESGHMIALVEAGDYGLDDIWQAEAWITPEAKLTDSGIGIPEHSVPFRTLAIDCQRGFFWAEVRSWARNGSSRLRWFGRVETWNGLDDLAKAHRVARALVGADSGDNTQEVYMQTAKRGWKALKGSGQSDFAVSDGSGKTTRRFYSDKQRIICPGLKQRAELIVFANTPAKDFLAGLRSKRLHTYPRDVTEEYVKQLTSEILITDSRTGKRTWILPEANRQIGNHAFDCAVMGLILAVRWGVVGRDATEAPEAIISQPNDNENA